MNTDGHFQDLGLCMFILSKNSFFKKKKVKHPIQKCQMPGKKTNHCTAQRRAARDKGKLQRQLTHTRAGIQVSSSQVSIHIH